MHTFAYTRVSTHEQTTANQFMEMEAAGYHPDASYSDTISGKVPADERPEFAKMLDAIERTKRPKRLIVTKLDRLGRDAPDVMAMVTRLKGMECTVKVLQLGDFDLTSTAGKMVLATLAAVSEMERDLLIERTEAGQARAWAAGKQKGRPKALSEAQVAEVRKRLAVGQAVAAVAREFGVGRATIIRAREAA